MKPNAKNHPTNQNATLYKQSWTPITIPTPKFRAPTFQMLYFVSTFYKNTISKQQLSPTELFQTNASFYLTPLFL